VCLSQHIKLRLLAWKLDDETSVSITRRAPPGEILAKCSLFRDITRQPSTARAVWAWLRLHSALWRVTFLFTWFVFCCGLVASMLSISSSVCLFVCLSVAKMQKNAIFSKTKQFKVYGVYWRVDWKCRTRKWRTKKDERTENAGLKMKDQMSWVENAGPENGGPKKMKELKMQDWKCRTKCHGWKMQDLKMKDQMSWVENAGPENAGPKHQAGKWRTNSRKLIMKFNQ